MTNKQELINWMTEKREGLTFENKVQLIWDYWQSKDKLPLLENTINQKEQKIQDLKEQITEIQKIDDAEFAKLKQEITKKDDRIAQLQKLFQGGAKILEKQYNYILQLKKDLEKEKSEKGTSQEKATHLQEDIQRLDQEKSELDQQIKELKQEEVNSKTIRDKELADEKQKVLNLTTKLNGALKVDELVYNLLGQHSSKANLLERTQEVIDKVKDLEAQKLTQFEQYAITWTQNCINEMANGLKNSSTLFLDNYQNYFNSGGVFHVSAGLTKYGRMYNLVSNLINAWNQTRIQIIELQKEKGWWDKWIIDEEARLVNFNQYPQFYWPKTNVVQSMNAERGGNLVRRIKEEFYLYYRDK